MEIRTCGRGSVHAGAAFALWVLFRGVKYKGGTLVVGVHARSSPAIPSGEDAFNPLAFQGGDHVHFSRLLRSGAPIVGGAGRRFD